MIIRPIRAALALAALVCVAQPAIGLAGTVVVSRSFAGTGPTMLSSSTHATANLPAFCRDPAFTQAPLSFDGITGRPDSRTMSTRLDDADDGLLRLSWQGLATVFVGTRFERLQAVVPELSDATDRLPSVETSLIAGDPAGGKLVSVLTGETGVQPQRMHRDNAVWTLAGGTARPAAGRHFFARPGRFAVLPAGRHRED